MIRVLITDDHQILLESLSMLISTIKDIEITGTLNDSREVIDFLEHTGVDLLITDYNMPYLTGIDLTWKVKQQFPAIKVLMLTVSEEAAVIRQAFQAGISGYVMKKANRAELEKAIKTVMALSLIHI